MSMGSALFELSDVPLDVPALSLSLSSGHAGALVSFEGRVRDSSEGRRVTGLEYDAYLPLCRREGEAVVREAQGGVIAARCVHRVGRLTVGEVSVWVGVIAAHREVAFRACRQIIDEVKRRVPIWKKETFADGTAAWVGLPAATQPAGAPPAALNEPHRRDA
jgi:molybdopterin synthase catalytic subunit